MAKTKFIAVLINGLAGAGKDTFVQNCKEYVNKRYPFTCHVINRHSSDLAKTALECIGWNGVKTPESRDLLAQLVDFGNKFNMTERYFIHTINDTIRDVNGQYNFVVLFFHERDPKMLERLRKYHRFKGTNWRLELKFLFLKRENAEPNEPDLWGVEDFTYSEVMSLSSLQDNKTKAEYFMENLINECSM